MRFVPLFSPLGWGSGLPDIDSSTFFAGYYEISVPRKPINYWGTLGKREVMTRFIDPEEREGAAQWRSEGRGGTVASLRRIGGDEAIVRWRISTPWDAFLVAGMDIESLDSSMDSISLRLYEVRDPRYFPLSAKLLGGASVQAGRQKARLEASGFVRKGGNYQLVIECRGTRDTGGVRITGPYLRRGAPPRKLLVNTGSAERASENRGGSAGRRGGAMDFTTIQSDRPKQIDARFFELKPETADSAWRTMRMVRGAFRDRPEMEFRGPVNPFSVAAKEIFRETVDVIAESIGEVPDFFHLGGDEVFRLEGVRETVRAPYNRMSKGELYAMVVKERMDEVARVFARRYPGEESKMAFVLYGDMVGSLNGVIEGTLEARGLLVPKAIFPRKLHIMPWYYSSFIGDLERHYAFLGAPPGDLYSKFEWILRKDVSELTALGFDVIGLYSTDGTRRNLERDLRGAGIWSRICSDFGRGAAGSGRCLGMAYSGWDARGSVAWGSNYNGFAALAAHWLPGSQAITLSDRDGNGIVDGLEAALKVMEPGQ